MTNPEDFEPDLDDLTRAQLYELGDMPGVVATVRAAKLHGRIDRGISAHLACASRGA